MSPRQGVGTGWHYRDRVHRLSAIVLVDRQGRLLLQERDEHAPLDASKWGLTGGHVDEGESFEEAAYRELAEETGVELDPGTLELWTEIERDHVEDGSRAHMQVWVAATDLADDDIVVGEGRQIVFVDPTRLPELDLAAIPGQVVRELVDSDIYRKLRA